MNSTQLNSITSEIDTEDVPDEREEIYTATRNNDFKETKKRGWS